MHCVIKYFRLLQYYDFIVTDVQCQKRVSDDLPLSPYSLYPSKLAERSGGSDFPVLGGYTLVKSATCWTRLWTLLVSLYVYLPFRQITPQTNIPVLSSRELQILSIILTTY